jgi:tape measure domain-containing protein
MANNLEYTLRLKDLFSKTMQGASNQVKGLDGKMNGLKKSISGVGTMIAGAFAVGAVVNFGKAVFDSLVNYEYFSTALRTLMNGDALASKALEGQLITLAKTTPFELTEIQTATKQLMAYGVAGGDVTRTLKMLGNVSAGLGKESLPMIIRAFGQIKAKGHLAGGELNQLTEQGFNPLNLMVKKTGKSYEELLKEMEKGKITFDMVEQSFKDSTSAGGQFFNMMESQSNTVGGKWSNFMDTWEQIRVNIGKSQSGIIAGTIDFINSMSNKINDKLSAGNFMDDAFKSAGVKGYSAATEMYGNLAGFKSISALAGNFAEMKETAIYMQSLIEQGTTGAKAKQSLDLINLNKSKLQEKYKNKEIDAVSFTREMSLYNAAFKGITGNMMLLKSKGEKSQIEGAGGVDDGKGVKSLGTGTEVTGQRPQAINININELVHELNIQTNNMIEGAGRMKELVSKALLEAVNDINLIAMA